MIININIMAILSLCIWLLELIYLHLYAFFKTFKSLNSLKEDENSKEVMPMLTYWVAFIISTVAYQWLAWVPMVYTIRIIGLTWMLSRMGDGKG